MKYKIFTALALAGSALAELFGGWDMALETLLILMAADWITGDYYGAAEPPVRCGVSHLSGLTEPLH